MKLGTTDDTKLSKTVDTPASQADVFSKDPDLVCLCLFSLIFVYSNTFFSVIYFTYEIDKIQS